MSSRPPVISRHQLPNSSGNNTQTHHRVQKVLLQPIAILFRYLQDHTPVAIWLHDRADMRITGTIVGFDEYMNVVVDGASEVYPRHPEKPNRPLGRIMLKGDNICLVQASK